VADGDISIDDPRAPDVRDLLERHLAFVNAQSPPEDVHALDVEGLLDPAISFYSFRIAGRLLGVGALKRLDRHHAEIKSMHTAAEARGRGVGRAMVDHLIHLARGEGLSRLSLETGTAAAFAPARSLYASAGFAPCGPFGDYVESAHSTFMTRSLGADPRGG
jgi:putative acetyltransferase